MSVDERLRGALREQADAFTPEVETALDLVRARGRIARWRSAGLALTASAAAVAAIAGALVAVDRATEGGAPPAGQRVPTSSGAPPPSPAPLRGSITADVTRPVALAGQWVLRLEGNGSIGVEPPAGYEADVSSPAFTADEASFRTSLFQEDICTGEGSGIYTWLRVGGRIDFQTVSDTCQARARFFTDTTWTMSTGQVARD